MARCARLARDRRDARARVRRPHRGRPRSVFTTPSPPPSVEDLTRIAHLSESRLQHLFRDQVGVPIRRYLLWHRYLTALSLLADGASVTRAAHAAGFADSAHLTRTAVRMNGFTPTKMPFRMWLTNCR